MNDFWTRCSNAIAQLLSGDPQLWGIVGVSLSVSASALLIALLPALSTRFMLAYFRFLGRWTLQGYSPFAQAYAPVNVSA
tara:strand:+ start:678 stop:917 length:240 start_codon:yes stop_codon:yes gene_type:complete